jgi:uncharacterized protein (TIGR02266 family)
MDEFNERRRCQRVPISERCWCEASGTSMYVSMTNVSRGGAFLKTAIPLPVGHRAVLRWSLPDARKVEAEAEVVWVSGNRDSIPGMGFKFLNVSTGSESLEDYLEK